MAYITEAQLTAYGDWASTDVLLGDLITRAQQIIDSYTGRTFECTSDDEAARYFNSIDDVEGYTLWLDEDLNTVASITVGTDTIPSSDYVTMPRNEKPYYALKLRSTSSYDWSDYDDDPMDNIVVTAQWAYSSDAPADIQHACLRLTKWLYDQRSASVEIDRPLLTADGVTIMPMKLPGDVIDILNRYKRLVVR